MGMRRASRLVTGAAFAWIAVACSAPETGTLRISVRDAATGEATPARVELLDARGEAHVPAPVLPMMMQCATSPPPAWAEWTIRSDRIDNPHTGTTQFYVDRPAQVDLSPGTYRLRGFKGIEYGVTGREVEVRAGETADVTLELARWIDMPREGWWAADDHLHITRLAPEDDPWIAHWMQAEDLNVANLLQMGTQAQFGVTPQRAFGDEGSYREGNTLVLAGQEHPRTHFLGHTITLGARAPVDLRDTYIVYGNTWREAERRGGVSGFAHYGEGPARDGLALDAPGGRLRFIEVLQFEFAHYDVWYEVLDLGIRMAPTAGTDFPCGPWSLPGRERFYTRIDGDLGREAWLDGIRRGRTFVTNGPLLSLSVDGADIGDDVRLDAPGPVRVAGRARFDPTRDDVTRLELVRNGRVVAAETARATAGEIRLETEVHVDASSWLALRAVGGKRGESNFEAMPFPDWFLRFMGNIARGADILPRRRYAQAHDLRPTAAHTAPIYVLVGGVPLAEQAGARERARSWLARLDALEARLAEDRIHEIPIWDWVPYSDGVSEEHLRRNRDALLAALAEARARYTEIAR